MKLAQRCIPNSFYKFYSSCMAAAAAAAATAAAATEKLLQTAM